MKSWCVAIAMASVGVAVPVYAQSGPEQLDQVEPGKGEIQAEYYGGFAGDGDQSFELLYGVSDYLALGGEIEFSGPRDGILFESIALKALVRLADPEQGIGAGIGLQAGIDREGNLTGFESRAILESRGSAWWLQASLIAHHAREDSGTGTNLGYATSVQRDLGDGLWFGVEASGQLVRLGGDARIAPQGQHYLGPSLTIERRLGRETTEGDEVEIGIAWLQRIAGDGPGSAPRIFVQFVF